MPHPAAEPLPAPAAPAAQFAEAAADRDPPPEPVDPAHTKSLTAAIEAVMSHAPGRKADPEPKADPPAIAANSEPVAEQPVRGPPKEPPTLGADRPRPGWTPPPDAEARTAGPAPIGPTAAGRAPIPPFPARPLRPGEGPRRPPLPARFPTTDQPSRVARAPWPEPGDPGPPRAPALANGAHPGSGSPPTLDRPDLAARIVPKSGGQADKGLLMEDVPRRMRVGRPATAEVRIARDRVDGLLAALNGREPGAAVDATAARALSVRLRGAKGGFWIEPATPETQWLEARPDRLDDGHIVWRWTIVPRRTGRSRLTLSVAAHTVGREGLTGAVPPSERPVEVKVSRGFLRRTSRLLGWLIAAAAGYAAASFGPEYWPMLAAAVRSALGA
jgi:neural Wiskott-Aldrich syndrome protein